MQYPELRLENGQVPRHSRQTWPRPHKDTQNSRANTRARSVTPPLSVTPPAAWTGPFPLDRLTPPKAIAHMPPVRHHSRSQSFSETLDWPPKGLSTPIARRPSEDHKPVTGFNWAPAPILQRDHEHSPSNISKPSSEHPQLQIAAPKPRKGMPSAQSRDAWNTSAEVPRWKTAENRVDSIHKHYGWNAGKYRGAMRSSRAREQPNDDIDIMPIQASDELLHRTRHNTRMANAFLAGEKKGKRVTFNETVTIYSVPPRLPKQANSCHF